MASGWSGQNEDSCPYIKKSMVKLAAWSLLKMERLHRHENSPQIKMFFIMEPAENSKKSQSHINLQVLA